MSRFSQLALLCVFCLALHKVGGTQLISWDSPQLFGYDPNAAFFTQMPGTIVYAASIQSTDSTLSIGEFGINFDPFGIAVQFDTAGTYPLFFSFTGEGDVDYLLSDVGVSATNSLTLTGLKTGVVYQVQLFAIAPGFGGGFSSQQSYQAPQDDAASPSIELSAVSYIVGTFTATSSVQQINILPDSPGDSVFLTIVILRAQPGVLCAEMDPNSGKCAQCVAGAVPVTSSTSGDCGCISGYLNVDGIACQLPMCAIPSTTNPAICGTCVANAILQSNGVCMCSTAVPSNPFFRTIHNTCEQFTFNGGTVALNVPFDAVLTCPQLYDPDYLNTVTLKLVLAGTGANSAIVYSFIDGSQVAKSECISMGSYDWRTFPANSLAVGDFTLSFVLHDPLLPIFYFTNTLTVTPPIPNCILTASASYDLLGEAGAFPGTNIQVSIRFANTGLTNCVGVTISDSLPATLTYVHGSLYVNGIGQTDSAGDDRGSYSAATQTVLYNLNTIANGQNILATFEAQIGCVNNEIDGFATVSGGPDVADITSVLANYAITVGAQTSFDECTLLSSCASNPPCTDTDLTTCGTTSCGCPPGFKVSAQGFCLNIDDCPTANCPLNSHCLDGIQSYLCICDAGYDMINGVCVDDINDCVGVTCPDPHSHCVDGVATYTCVCNDGFSFDMNGNCVQTVNYCDGVVCADPNSFCVNGESSYTCVCDNGFDLVNDVCVDDIDNCVGVECTLHSHCVDGVATYTCVCDTGFEFDGTACIDANACDGVVCPDPNSSCVNGDCVCNTGYVLVNNVCTVIDYCMMSACPAHSHCVDGVMTYTCECDTGYDMVGGVCTDDINDCAGVVCPDSNAHCVDGVATYTCVCNDGYYLNNNVCILSDINHCATNNGGCDVHATCYGGINAGGINCVCFDGYNMVNNVCVQNTVVNACATNNGGCDAHATCYGGIGGGGVTCVCFTGYNTVGNTCVANNACANNNGGCDPNAVCSTTLGTYSVTCTCNLGFSGNGWYCAPPQVNQCATNNGGCDVNANCYGGIGGGSVTCVCFNGYNTVGNTCVANNACATNNGYCDANAICSTTLGTYSVICTCKQGYVGNGWYCALPTPPVCTCSEGSFIATDCTQTANVVCHACCDYTQCDGTTHSDPQPNCFGGGGGGSTWDCPYPPTSSFDWRYTPPTCEALTVDYPANLPAGQSNDVNVRIHTHSPTDGDITLNFHNNTGCWSGETVFYLHQHPNFPADVTSYSVEWVQVGGTNCHWSGDVECGQTLADTGTTSPSGAHVYNGAYSCYVGDTPSDWAYPIPTCQGLAVVYPSGITGNDVNIRIWTDKGEVTLNFHSNTHFTHHAFFHILSHPAFPAGVSAYTIEWVQVDGSNCHWNGAVSCTI